MDIHPSSTSQFVRIGQGEPSGSTVSHLKLRLFSLSTLMLLVLVGVFATCFNLKLRLFSNYTHFTTSQFAELAKANRQVRQFHISS